MLLTSGILLTGSGLAGINSLIPCNDWPTAGGVSVALGSIAPLTLKWLRPRQNPASATAGASNALTEETVVKTEKYDEG